MRMHGAEAWGRNMIEVGLLLTECERRMLATASGCLGGAAGILGGRNGDEVGRLRIGPVTGARDAALKKGITINGLPIMLKGTSPSIMDIDDLDLYYEDCAMEGQTRLWWQSGTAKLKEAIRNKLVLEVAGRMPEHRIVAVAEKRAAGALSHW